MSGKIQKNDIISPEALKVFQEIVAGYKLVMKSAQKTSKSVKDSGLEEMTFQEKELAKQHQQLGKLTAQLEKSTTGYAKEIIKTKEALRKKNAETKESITGQKAERKAQQEATAARKAGNAILVKHIQNTKSFNAIVKQGKQQLREQTKEQQRLTREQQKATRAAEKQTKAGGKTSKMFGGLVKSALSYGAAMFGITEIIRFFTSTLLKLTTRLDSLDFSMKTVITSSDEFAQTNMFLSETAIDYGQDILVLTERYIKFRAATMQANMSAKETQQIFDSAAKSAAVLGLKTDEVNGVFLALEQMISKGKVTTEELRRQLGERLPGAFGIMADAMGVPLRELDRMLKAGEVLSAEALPKFAVALEEAYGIESVEKVNTLAAAQGRLKTAWVVFVDELQASSIYIKIISELADALNELKASLGLGNEFDYLMLAQNKFGRAFRSTKEEMDNYDLSTIIREQEKWIEILDESGLRAKTALSLIEEYIERRKIAEKDSSMQDLTVFDFETEKKQLSRAKKEFENFNKIQKQGFKEVFLENAVFLEGRGDSYEDYIQRQIKLYDDELKAASETAKKEEEVSRRTLSELEQLRILYGDSEIKWQKDLLKEALLRHKQQRKIEEASLSNYAGLLEYRTLLESEYYDDREDKSDDSLKIMKEQHKQELEETKQQQQQLILQNKYTEDELFRVNFDNNKELLLQEKEQLQKQLDAVKGNALEEEKLRTKIKKIDAKIAKEITDFRIEEEERWLDEKQDKLDEEIAGIYEEADEARVAEAERARDEFQSTKKRGRDKQLIMAESAMNMIEIEMDAAQKIIEATEKGTDERARAEKDLKKLKERYAEADIKLTEYTERKKQEEIQNTLNAVKEINQAAFEFNSALNERQMQANETMFRRETELAGENAEQKAIAEVRYNERKRELQRRQAIADKAQAVFGIIVSTAQAIMATLEETGVFGIPLTPIVAGIGALQLATVLAQPIPQFAKGTKDAPETFIAGEQNGGKRELVLTRNNDAFLTPDSPTLFSDKSFVGATVVPNDQTEAILSGRSGGSSVDLKSTNSLLKDIRDKKDNKETIEYSGGYKIVRKNGFVGKYRVN